MKNRFISAILVMALVALLVPGIASAEEVAPGNGQAGTTLDVSITAEGYWYMEREYDWSLTKMVVPESAEIARDASAPFDYMLIPVRTLVWEAEAYGVRGGITVTNGGDRPTEDLTIKNVVQTKVGSGQYVDNDPNVVDVSAKPVLAPGETYTYPYDFRFGVVPGAEYRSTARVTITNHSGDLGTPSGPAFASGGVKENFTIPAEPNVIEEMDEAAQLADVLTVPEGFSAVVSDTGPWNLTDSGVINYTVTLTNVSAMADSWFEMTNTATLTELDTGTVQTASALVEIYTPPVATESPLSHGFMKTHAGFNGKNADRVTPQLPIWLGTAGGAKSVQVTDARQAVHILEMRGDASNGINKLYCQMLTAKWNIKRGAIAPASVQTAISQADAFLAGKDASDWSSLSRANRKLVSDWAELFDHYNNGEL